MSDTAPHAVPDPAAHLSLLTVPKGSLRLFRIAGVPVYAHWTSALPGLVLSGAASGNPRVMPGLMLGYVLVVAVHEADHALAAALLGLRVYQVQLQGFGGRCVVQTARRRREALVVFGAGLLAQIVLFAATLLAMRHAAGPTPAWVAGVALACLAGNALVFVANLWPSTSPDGWHSDGRVLQRLLADRWHGRTFLTATLPGTNRPEASPLFPPGTSLLGIAALVPAGFMQGVEVLNDATTPFAFVVQVFTKHLGWEATRALAQAIEIHNRGGALIALPSTAEAARVAAAISEDAAQAGHAFVCRAVDAYPVAT